MGWLTDYTYKGKHRDLNERDSRVTWALALLSATALSSISHGRAAADPPGGWGSIIACESGGKNIRTQIPGPFTASGYFQITNGTWRANGGSAFSSTAVGASFEQQRTVANNIYARNRSLSDWAASRSCWASGKKQVTIQIPRAVSPAKPIPVRAKPKLAPSVARSTPPPHSAIAPTSGGKHRIHVVRRGDTLARIAGTHWRAVWNLNRATVPNPNRIYPGQHLKLS